MIVPANSVPAAAVIRGGQLLFGVIWRKGFEDGLINIIFNEILNQD